ncbi:MAG: chromate transporter [Bacillota bacterium]|jgi:chromate transporter
MEDTEKRFDHHAVPLSGIFWSFFKIGAFTFGGGWAMIPLIRKELVSNKKWLDDSEFVDVLAIAQSGPGPIAVNTATVTGLKMRGLPGAFAAVLGSTLPSFLVIFALATVLVRFRNSGVLEAIFTGMRPAIFGLLVSATWQVGKKSLKNLRDIAFVLVGAVLVFFMKINPIYVVLVSGLFGVLIPNAPKRSVEPSGEER